LVSLGRYEQHASAGSFEIKGAVKVHYPVLQFLRGRRLLDFCPLGDKIRKDLRLDRMSGEELEVKFSQLHRPLDDVTISVAAMEDLP